MTNSILMVDGKNTPILDFGYGNMSSTTYSIKAEGMQYSESTGSTSSTASQGNKDEKSR